MAGGSRVCGDLGTWGCPAAAPAQTPLAQMVGTLRPEPRPSASRVRQGWPCQEDPVPGVVLSHVLFAVACGPGVAYL